MKLTLKIKNKVLNAANKVSLNRQVTKKLAKHVLAIKKVEIQVDDVYTKKSGTFHQCEIILTLFNLPSIHVKSMGKDLIQSIKRALDHSQLVLAQKHGLTK